MATTESGGSNADAKQKKTVQVVAYAAHGAFKSERAMADELDDDRDYYSRERRTNRSVELVHTDDDGRERTQLVFGDDLRDALMEADIRHDSLDVREEIDVERPYKHSPGTYVSDVRKRLARTLPDKLTGEVDRALWAYKWQNDQAETMVHIRADSLDHRRVLLHRTERNGRRKYETERKHLSAAFTIEMGPEQPDIISEWSDEVVKSFVDALWNLDWVHKVRVADCTETVEKQGDCFSL